MSQAQMGLAANPTAGRPGKMTAVMLAVPQAIGPKILRVGVVQEGHIVEERLVKPRVNVTIGPSEKAMFVVTDQHLPPQFKLFELIGGAYHLNFLEEMTGRVALPTGITDMTALRTQARRVGNGYQIKLTDDARGKITVGRTTFLFQFIIQPPVQPRPQLPLAVKGGLGSQIDWNLTTIAAFSFLIHFGLVGGMYSDWMDPVVNEDIAVKGLIELTKSIPPPPVEEKPVASETPKQTTTTTTHAPAAKASSGGGRSGGRSGPISEARSAALAAQAEAMQMQMLAAFGGSSAVQGALDRSDIPPVDLSGVAASQAGVSTTGSGDLKMEIAGGGPIQPGRGGGLGAIGGSTSAQGSGGAGMGRDVGGPKGEARIGASSASAPVANMEATIARIRPGFKICYQQGLNVDPSMSGKVVFNVKIGPNGEVESVTAASNTGLSDQVIKCLSRKIKNAQFNPPGGTGSTIQFPVSFVQQGK
ncbi:AgmX/PglI C-terminal domain-containing protein [Pajaroellobacter abortibovis]|uniref:TonB C-terminal domain-containing protein n=1 Tax=Pajaroellobacter abortibovis TaxID=1882918 RepID=A0A1L6MXT7_9BACT|nr:AgmX/PglI C-terminal domain-containing protein [Pajaroellobacter abortibovis]APS00299.1 hypothetical protein BCY86_06095 [Pajaroellobacter abortibovis]